MKKRKLAIILPIAAAVIFVGGTTASAFGPAMGQNQNDFAQRFANKFNLSVSDVENFVNTERLAHQKEMQTEFESRIAAMVAEGKITEAQKAAIIAKHTEIQTKMGELRMLEPQARVSAMNAYQSELKTWASENGISENVMPFFGKGFGKGSGLGRGGFGRLGM